MNSALTALGHLRARLVGDRRGNVAMIWALSATVTLSLLGLSIDFSRAHSVRTQVQNAADGAALVAERMSDRPLADRQAAAEQFFRASLTDLQYAGAASISIVEEPGGGHRATASMPSTTTLSRLVTGRDFSVSASSVADQAGTDLEVAVVLDITGSMAGQRIADLKLAAADLVDIIVRDEQTPYYSKVALVPYSNAVNLGGNAGDVRGAVVGGTSIADANWRSGTGKAITGANKTNAVMVHSNGHGFVNGDRVYISGVGGMTQINNKQFTVSSATANNFRLSGVNGTSYGTYTSGGTVTKCATAACEVVVTSNAHGLATGAHAFVTGVNGMTQINNAANTTWVVTKLTANTFALNGSNGPSYSAYTGSGAAHCTVAGCDYLRFDNASSPSAQRVFAISTCVSERTGANAFTDEAPTTTRLGRVYPAASNPCPAAQVVPLSSDKAALTATINGLTTAGSTAGHLGAAWGWYMLTPEFGYLWPAAGRPANLSTQLRKIAVLMTDGDFNTPYCNGVIGRDAGSGSGSVSDHIGCNAPNGSSFSQAAQICTNMKAAGVTVYTVGFEVANGSQAQQVLNQCASSSGHAYNASSGAELRDAFRDIATAISLLRLTQ